MTKFDSSRIPVTVACVLCSGGVYGAEDVRRLRAAVRRHFDGAEFAVLSDLENAELVAVDTSRVRLKHVSGCGWTGWWSKLELFRPALFAGRVIYLDLDTLVLGDIGFLATYTGPFAALRDFWNPSIQASGVMAWDGSDPPPLYEIAKASPPDRMPNGRFDLWWNQYIVADVLQDLYPGRIVSFKEHCGEDDPPREARVVCFHGRPTLRDLEPEHWAAKTWRAAGEETG